MRGQHQPDEHPANAISRMVQEGDLEAIHEKAKGKSITLVEPEHFQLDVKYIKALAKVGTKNY